MIFGNVLAEPAADGSTLLTLNEYGLMCCRQIEAATAAYPAISMDAYVVMPNHVHMLCTIDENEDASGRSLLSRFVGYIKSETSKAMHRSSFEGVVWQRGFYDHIVRDEYDFSRIFEYIENNPATWAEDRFYE